MIIRKAILIVLIAFTFLIGALHFFAQKTPWEKMAQAYLEYQLSKWSGHDVFMEDLQFEIVHFKLALQGLHAKHGTEELVHVPFVSFKIDPLPLLWGKLSVEELQIRGAHIAFQTPEGIEIIGNSLDFDMGQTSEETLHLTKGVLQFKMGRFSDSVTELQLTLASLLPLAISKARLVTQYFTFKSNNLQKGAFSLEGPFLNGEGIIEEKTIYWKPLILKPPQQTPVSFVGQMTFKKGFSLRLLSAEGFSPYLRPITVSIYQPQKSVSDRNTRPFPSGMTHSSLTGDIQFGPITAKLQWNRIDQSVEGEISLSEVFVLEKKIFPSSLSLLFKENSLLLQSQDKKAKIKVEAYLRGKDITMSGTYKSREATIGLHGGPSPLNQLELHLDGTIALSLFRSLTPLLKSITGKGNINGVITGINRGGELFGTIQFQEATAIFSLFPDPIQDLRGSIHFSHSHLSLSEIEGRVGKGNISLRGEFDLLSDKGSFSLESRLDHIALNIPTWLKTVVSGPMTVEYLHPNYRVTGGLTVHQSLYQEIWNLEPSALSLFKSTPVTSESRKYPVEFDIQCDAPQNLFIKNNLMDAEMKGNFHISGPYHQLRLLGDLNLVKGKFFFRGHPFDMNQGYVSFDSPSEINPHLSAQAQSSIHDYLVSLQLDGRLNSYDIKLSSQPYLSQEDIFTLLTLGFTRADIESKNFFQMTSLELGSYLFRELQNYWTPPIRSLGIDLRLSSLSQKEMQVQYDLGEHVSLLGHVGEGDRQETWRDFSLGLDFKFQYEFP